MLLHDLLIQLLEGVGRYRVQRPLCLFGLGLRILALCVLLALAVGLVLAKQLALEGLRDRSIFELLLLLLRSLVLVDFD